MSIILSSFEDCNSLKDMIRHVTFLENISPPERQLSNYFAVQMYDHIINKMALMTPSSTKKSILGEDTLSRTSKLLGLNNNIWNVYKNPLKEFER